MKKRYLVIALCVGLLLCALCPLMAGAEKTGSTILAGYASITIDPSQYVDADGNAAPITGLQMRGYGDVRLSTGTLAGDSGLQATCAALTDAYGKTILILGVDTAHSGTTWSTPGISKIVKAAAAAGYNVDASDVFLTASHTHSGVDMNDEADIAVQYREWVYDQLVDVCLAALDDQIECTMTKGSVDASKTLADDNALDTNKQYEDGDPATRMNYIRHYKNAAGTEVWGSNFGIGVTRAGSSEVSEADDTLYLVQFKPTSGSGDPIVLVNWRAHSTMNSTQQTAYGKSHYYEISADYVGQLRTDLAEGGYRSVFIQGAAGNVVPNLPDSPFKSIHNPLVTGTSGSPEGHLYGAKLAEIALYGLAHGMDSTPLDTSYIRTATTTFNFYTHVPTSDEQTLIANMQKITPSNIDEKSTESWRTTYSSSYSTFKNSTYTNLYTFMVNNWSSSNRTAFSKLTGISYLTNIQSKYHLSNANSNLKYVSSGESTLNVGAIAIGTQLSFVVSPCELSDRYSTSATLSDTSANDWDKLVNSDTFGTPLVLGYARGSGGYMPNALAYSYNGGEGSYESQSSDYAQGTGEKMIDYYYDLLKDINTTEGVRIQCECGGTLEDGEHGHKCNEIQFLPWNDPYTLPESGNYYLTTDVITRAQRSITGSLHLDLNGHNIAARISSANAPKITKQTETVDDAENSNVTYTKSTHSTRVFYVGGAGQLTITDSSDGAPGTITRDLSYLTQREKELIDNYGLIIQIVEGGSGDVTIYNGVLDAEGARTGGGGVVANLGRDGITPSTFTMYGGTLKGGATQKITGNVNGTETPSNTNGGIIYNWGNAYIYGGEIIPYVSGTGTNKNESSYGGAIYNTGTLEIYGGTINGGSSSYGGAIYNSGTAKLMGGIITGGETRQNSGNCGGVYVASAGKLTIGGDVQIINNNKIKTGTPTNIRFSSYSKLKSNFKIEGPFTGKASIYIDSSASAITTKCTSYGSVIGTCTNAVFAPDSFYLDYVPDYDVVVSGNQLVLTMDTYAATVTSKTATTPYATLAAAAHAAKNGDVITILTDNSETVTFPSGVTVDLYGHDLTGNITVTDTTFFKDSRTDDYGVAVKNTDRYGYGKITGTVNGTIKGLNMDKSDETGDFYLPITVKGATSLHRVNLNFVGLALRPDSCDDNTYHPGIYYNAQFGGDENVRDNITSYGIALAVNKAPDFAENTYSELDPKAKDSHNKYIWQLGISANGIANNLSNGTLLKNILQTSNNYSINWRNGNIAINGQAYVLFNGERIKGPMVSYSLRNVLEGKQTSTADANDGVTGVNKLWNTLDTSKQSEINKMYLNFSNILRVWDIDNIHKDDDGILKVLALDTDDVAEIRKVFEAEFGENVVVASFNSNSTSDTATYNDGSSDTITLSSALMKHDWDYVVLRGKTDTIQSLSKYIKDNDPNKHTTTKIAWDLSDLSEYATVSNAVDCVIPTYTAVQNATTGKLTDTDSKVAAYVWYCALTDTAITDCAVKIDDKTQRNILMNAVNNAIDKPATVTAIEDDGVLKVLVIGHSLGMDSSYLFPAVAKENNTKILVGTLYHSGCQLKQHANYIQRDLQEYAYLEFDTTKQDYWYIWDKTQGQLVQHDPNQHHDEYIGVKSNTSGKPNKYGVTMEFAIERHDWDVVIMMAGSSEATGAQIPGNVLSLNNLKIIRDHVLANDCDSTTIPMFAWNLTWAYPETATELEPGSASAQENEYKLTTYFESDSETMYQAIADTAQKTILSAYHFDYLLPNGTALQNARSKYAEADLYRDRVHATDYMRLMAGATWYSVLTGTDANSVKIPTTIADVLTHKDKFTLTLNDTQITDLKTAVGNAIANPYGITPIS